MSEEKSRKTIEKRIISYLKDIQVLTGKSECYALKMVAQIKEELDKKTYQPLSIKEFCLYIGLEVEKVKKALV
jgi:hypothetical protein